MLVVDLRSSLAYFMMTHPLPVAGKLPIKTLVARQLPTNTHTHTQQTHIWNCALQGLNNNVIKDALALLSVRCLPSPQVWPLICQLGWVGITMVCMYRCMLGHNYVLHNEHLRAAVSDHWEGSSTHFQAEMLANIPQAPGKHKNTNRTYRESIMNSQSHDHDWCSLREKQETLQTIVCTCQRNMVYQKYLVTKFS